MADAISLTAQVVAAYVATNKLSPNDLPDVVTSVQAAIVGSSQSEAEVAPEVDLRKSKAEIRRSITPDALISFLDGKPYRTLKRHLATKGMSITDYRSRFGLPDDYPSTAANYSAQRSAMARAAGLGQKREKNSASLEPDTAAPQPAKSGTKPRRTKTQA